MVGEESVACFPVKSECTTDGLGSFFYTPLHLVHLVHGIVVCRLEASRRTIQVK